MVLFVILLAVAAALALFLTVRSGRFWGVFPYALGWWGSWLALGSLLALPFLRLGTPEQMRANAGWLVQKADLVRVVYRLPDAEQWLPPLPELKAETILEKLEAPNKERLLDYVHTQRLVNGLRLMRLAQPVRPLLTLTLAAAGLAGLLGVIVFGARLLNPGIFSAGVVQALSAASLVLLFMLFGYLTLLDTLGQHDDLPLRLLLVFAQAQPGPGIWGLLLGLALCALGSFPDWLGLSTGPTDRDDEPYT